MFWIEIPSSWNLSLVVYVALSQSLYYKSLHFTPGSKHIEKFHQRNLKILWDFEMEILYITSVNGDSETVYIQGVPWKNVY